MSKKNILAVSKMNISGHFLKLSIFLGIFNFFGQFNLFQFFFPKILIFLPYNFDQKWDLLFRNPILNFLPKHRAANQFQKTDLILFETVKVSLKLVTKKSAFLA